MQVIAAIDLWAGKAVRLRQGDFDTQEEISTDPLALGAKLYDWGVRWWHVVDLMGAKGDALQRPILTALRKAFPDVRMNLGGGLRDETAINWAIQSGFDHLIVGSAAVSAPEKVKAWLRQYGPERFIIAADLKGGLIATHGWQKVIPMPIQSFFMQWREAGIQAFLCTEVERDGMLAGPNLSLYTQLVQQAAPAQVIASGGIRGKADLEALASLGIGAAIVGKALYTDPTASEWVRHFC